MNHYQQSFHPYFNPAAYDELKSSRRRTKQPTDSRHAKGKRCGVSPPTIRKSPAKTNLPSNVGNYILSDINPASCLCKAVDIRTWIKFSCRVVDPRKYQEIAALYHHPVNQEGINAVKEIIIRDEAAYIVLERSYSDLHTYVRTKRRLTELEACHLFSQIVKIVAGCHESGLVLRDLKLRKFVFKDKEQTKLQLETLDGAAILSGKNCDTLYDKHGCPAYVSPEVLESTCAGYSGKPADIWSLGVIFYTILFGRYPFHDQDPVALFTKIRSGQFTIPDTVSSKAKCLLRSLLRKDPASRLTAVEALEHPWFSSNFELDVESFIPERAFDQVVPSSCSAKVMSYF